MHNFIFASVCMFGFVFAQSAGCVPAAQPVSDTGVGKAKATVKVGSDGVTAEQRNIQKRIALENQPGSIKHLYIVSTFSGDVLVYSTVKGKVTSSGKRLTPNTINWSFNGTETANDGDSVFINGRWRTTNELIQDDGTYGSSSEYLYWFDANDRYMQTYVGDSLVILSDQPIPITKSKLGLVNLNGDE